MNSNQNDSGFFKRNWIAILIIILLLVWNIWLQLQTSSRFGFGEGKTSLSELCYDKIESGIDSSQFIKLDVEFNTAEPAKFHLFTFSLNAVEYRPCFSMDSHKMSAYINVGEKDSVFALNSVVRSSKGNSEYTLLVKAFDAAGALIGTFEKKDTVANPYETSPINNYLKTKRRDQKTTSVIAGHNSH